MSESSKAVFLSYASQDAEAAKRICEALRAAGVEVWFDQSELVGGDAWDQSIRKQISECALFIPVLSETTQARREAYFRLEWKLADERTHLMAEGTPFLLPVTIDQTTERGALVPKSFVAVQWTKLPGGETPAAFAARVKKLLGGSEMETGRPRPAARGEGSASPPKRHRIWLVPAVIGLVTIAAFFLWQPWRKNEKPSVVSPPPIALSPAAAELARVRARLIPERWQKGDFEALSPTLDRIIQASPEESDAWALRSIINSMQVTRNFDSGTKPLEVGRAAAERALRLAPESPLAALALGMHLNAMISRGGDPQAGQPHVLRAVAALPRDGLTRFAELVSIWQGYNAEATERIAKTWLAEEPIATYPAWILAQLCIIQRRPGDAEKWAETAAADRNITGTRARYTLFESKYYLRADLAAAKEALARVPAEGRAVHRVIHARWLLAMAEQRWDEALQELARVSEPMLYDRTYHGPRSLLAGLAHQRAGRPDAALVQFREAERLLRSELATDTDNEELHLVLAVTLACAGQDAEARSELAFVEPLLKGRAPSIYWGAQVIAIAQTYGVLGDYGPMAEWLRKLFVMPNGFPFTPASLRLDPRFTGMLHAPEIQVLLKEFASLDLPVATPSSLLPSPSSLPPVDSKSVAVLAFANLSDDKGNEYFSDGISEELLNVLAKIPGLKVSARTSAFYFKGKEVPIPEIAKQLGVAYVIEGSVRKQGDKVRITAQLIKAADGFHVWSDTFTRDLKDIFAVQDEIAGLIAQQLQLKLAASDQVKREVNPEAHQLVLEGRHYLTLRTAANFDQAERAFTAALKIDPQFAQAQAGLATTTALRGRYRLLDAVGRVEEFDLLAIAQARLALQMDPSLSEPHAAIGFVFTDRRQLAEAEQEFQKAFAANPNYSTAYHWHSHVFGVQGRLDLAIQEARRASALDPLSFIITYIHGFYTCDTQRYAEALAILDRAASLRGETFLPLEADRARMLFELGRKAEALAVARKVLGDPRLITAGWYAAGEALQVLQRGGEIAEATRRAEALIPAMPAGSYQRGYALCALGKFREGLPLLATMPVIPQNRIYFHPMFDPVRDTPEFRQLLVKLNCVEEYKVARATLARMLKVQTEK